MFHLQQKIIMYHQDKRLPLFNSTLLPLIDDSLSFLCLIPFPSFLSVSSLCSMVNNKVKDSDILLVPLGYFTKGQVRNGNEVINKKYNVSQIEIRSIPSNHYP